MQRMSVRGVVVMQKTKNTDPDDMLLEAVNNGSLKAASAAVAAGANVNRHIKNRTNGLPVTPILSYAIKRKPKIARFLLEHGADPNAKDVCGDTPLHHAIWYCPGEVTTMLIEMGAYVNSRNVHGYTPLCIALLKRQRKIMSMLATAGADPNICDNEGNNALNYSLLRSSPVPEDMFIAVIGMGADVNMPDNKGQTPLMKAASMTLVSYMKIIISAGADIKKTDQWGRTALDILREQAESETVYRKMYDELIQEFPEYKRLVEEDSVNTDRHVPDFDI